MLDENDCLVSEVVKTACLSLDSSSFEVQKTHTESTSPLDQLLYSYIYKEVNNDEKCFLLTQSLTETNKKQKWYLMGK